MRKVLIIAALTISAPLVKAEFKYLDRSEEGLLMGDAYTTLADDESVLFYNPAALGRNEHLTIQD